MDRIIRNLLLTFIIVCVLAGGLYCFAMLSFAGVFDKKYTREELTTAFTEHEKEFADLEAYFVAKIPKGNDQRITFGLGSGKEISLIISFDVVIDGHPRIVGADDVKPTSPKLDSALTMLGWTPETLVTLRDKLSKTNCDWIVTSGAPFHVTYLYPNQDGWGSFDYVIYSTPITDSLVKEYGVPIGHSEFGKRVSLDYTSAL
jgi:hypothetical protein